MSDTLTIRQKLFTFLFSQYNALQRIALVRITLSVIVLVLIVFGDSDPDYYAATADFLYVPHKLFFYFPALSLTGFLLLKYSALAATVLMLAGFMTRYVAWPFAILFLFFNNYIACFDSYWLAYITHLHFFSFALCFADSGKYYSVDAYLQRNRPVEITRSRLEQTSFMLAFMQAFIAVLYFQTGLAKLLNAGPAWFITGHTSYYASMLYGTDFGKYLVQFPLAFRFIGIYTGIVEIGFFFAFLFRRTRTIIVIMAIVLHIGIYFVMILSFFTLWWLYPALFLIKGRPDPQLRVTD